MLTSVETIPSYLERMRCKDLSKHGYDGGFRTTQEIAEYFSLSSSQLRPILWSLADAGLIDAYGRCEDWPGRPFLWSSVRGEEPDPDPDPGEEHPANDNGEAISCAI